MLRTIDSGITIGPTLRPTLSNCWLSDLQIEAELQKAQDIIDELQVALNIADIDFKLKRDRENLKTEEWTRIAAVPQACPAIEDEVELATKEDKVVAKEEKVVAKEDKVVTKEDKVVAKEEKVVAKEDKVVAKEDKVVAKEDKVVTKEDKDCGHGRLETIDEKDEDIVEVDFETTLEVEPVSGVLNEPELTARNVNPRHRRRNAVSDGYCLTGEPLKTIPSESRSRSRTIDFRGYILTKVSSVSPESEEDEESDGESSDVASEDSPLSALDDSLILNLEDLDSVQTVVPNDSQKQLPERSDLLPTDVAVAEESDQRGSLIPSPPSMKSALSYKSYSIAYSRPTNSL
ncbi:hypothetical protein HK103_001762 [Boothiomyces macroporosus]|uniref:Uncharacterized protein n=1 Tax=Boothiomyces macroporosus TaxID=261099 RepID=A0AAD5UJH2_9FUNG|nr:hypothetical protein HK103_001762 [Boothiomyces macroporosus]